MKRLLPALLASLSLCVGCASGSSDPDPQPDGAAVPDASADVSAEVSAEAPAPVPVSNCVDLAAAAPCRLSGTYQLTYDQVTTQSTADPSGTSCRQVSPRQKVVFTATGNRLCADVDDLTVSADGCTVDLIGRYRTDGGSEYWVNETRLHLVFAPEAGGALVGTGSARLDVSGFWICTKTATVTARAP